jgi:hypothetical protein
LKASSMEAYFLSSARLPQTLILLYAAFRILVFQFPPAFPSLTFRAPEGKMKDTIRGETHAEF